METRQYWEENTPVKYESYNTKDGYLPMGLGEQLNFSTVPSDDEGDYQSNYLKKGKVTRQDPMSHRIIEKRRRDRMNNCLADLSRLIPPDYLKKGRGRVEKTEIIEMAIRHLKFLQDKVIAAERQLASDQKHYLTGFQDAITETTRFFVEVQRFDPNDVICSQLTTHLQKHCNQLSKDDHRKISREKPRYAGSSSETNSSSSSSRNHKKLCSSFGVNPALAPPEHSIYEHHIPKQETYPMDCDKELPPQMAQEMESNSSVNTVENLAVHNRRNLEPNLRTIRKPEQSDEYIHSYKFKNCIERRFSKSQDTAESNEAPKINVPNKIYSHKRRRPVKQLPSTSTSNSGSTEEARDTSPQDTSSESPHNHYESPAPSLSTQFVPVFALNALGKFYVPLSIEYACIARYLGSYDALDARSGQLSVPLHPVTIHVNFQPCLNYHAKRQLPDRSWRGP